MACYHAGCIYYRSVINAEFNSPSFFMSYGELQYGRWSATHPGQRSAGDATLQQSVPYQMVMLRQPAAVLQHSSSFFIGFNICGLSAICGCPGVTTGHHQASAMTSAARSRSAATACSLLSAAAAASGGPTPPIAPGRRGIHHPTFAQTTPKEIVTPSELHGVFTKTVQATSDRS